MLDCSCISNIKNFNFNKKMYVLNELKSLFCIYFNIYRLDSTLTSLLTSRKPSLLHIYVVLQTNIIIK